MDLKEIPLDAILTFILLLIGDTGASLGVPLIAFPVILLLPGYALSVALFPRRDDLDPIERLVMCIGLNVSLVCMLAVCLDVMGIRLWTAPLLLTLNIATAAFMIISMMRRCGEENAYDWKKQLTIVSRCFHENRDIPEIGSSVKRSVPILLLVIAIAVALSVDQERPVELYLTDQNGDVPSSMSDVIIVVANHAGEESYRLDIVSDGRTLSSQRFSLNGESIWETNLSSEVIRNTSRIEITLSTDDRPVRRVHLLTKSIE
ncbi:MAG: DUF1616 domain-containing protein [Methanothrix sp.]|nr:DUF1616 domain-containing protein [Methanothrix sp.]